MKKIIPILIIVFSLVSIWVQPMTKSVNIDSNNILQRYLPDSVCALLKNKPLIFYARGHYGYSWSLIAKIDSVYRIYTGRVDYTGISCLNKASDSVAFDTTKFITHNNKILSWGFDTISAEATNMKKMCRTTYVTIYTDLAVYNSFGVNTFSSDDAIAFVGKDSLNFNKKFRRLCLLMWWLSNSKIREYFPDSIH